MSALRAVFFDVGETLVDETRSWGAWADWLGVPRLTFFGALGSVIERGEHHRQVFELFRPGLDVEAARAQRAAEGDVDVLHPSDFYPDVLETLAALRKRGLLLGITGNQPLEAESVLRAMGLPVDVIASSASWGVEKPSPAFFARLIAEAGFPAGEIAHVGDRLDNDVLPAREAGLFSVFIRRGPWGVVHARRPEVARAHLRIDSLRELLETLG